MKKLLVLLVLAIPFYCVSQPVYTVLFKTDSSELSDSARQVINRVEKLMKYDPACKIEIAGRTDDEGDVAYNQKLSEARIASVREVLNGNFSSKVVNTPLGETSPLVPNSTSTNKQQNRSVVITLTHCSADLNTPAGTRRIVSENFGPKTREVDFNAAKGVSVNLKNGTFIKIPEYAFCDKKGHIINSKVKLSITQYMSYPEMIYSGIPMNATDGILVSDGFFNIAVTKSGDSLRLRENSSIQMVMNNPNADSSMQYFSMANPFESMEWRREQGSRANVKVRKISFNPEIIYNEKPTILEKDSLRKLLDLLKLEENQDLTIQLVSEAFAKKDMQSLKHLVRVLDIRSIRFGLNDSSARYTSDTASIFLFESSSQREIKFNDDVFKSIDFNKANKLSFEMSNWSSRTFEVNKAEGGKDTYVTEAYNLIEGDVINSNKLWSKSISISQYLLNIPVLGFINCDRYLQQPNSVRFEVTLEEVPPSAIIQVVMPNEKSVILASRNSLTNAFIPALPKGEKVYLIAYAAWDGDLYLSKQEVVIGNTEKPIVKMDKVSSQELRLGLLANK